MKTTTIVSGNFATTGDKNFTAYTANGGKYFIHRNMMKLAGIEKDKDIKFPIYANVDTRMITPKLPNGEFSPVQVAREQAVAIFLTIEDAIKMNNADFELQAQITKARVAIGVASELSQEVLDALLINALV